MRTRRQWSRRVAIAGGSLTLLVLALWGLSRYRPSHLARTNAYIGLDRGRLFVATTDAPADPRLLAAIVEGVKTSGAIRTTWRPRSARGWGSSAALNGRFFYTVTAVPIPPIAAAVALLTALTFFLIHRRTPPHACPHCNYDLRGIPRGRCPECGTDPLLTRILRRLLPRPSHA